MGNRQKDMCNPTLKSYSNVIFRSRNMTQCAKRSCRNQRRPPLNAETEAEVNSGDITNWEHVELLESCEGGEFMAQVRWNPPEFPRGRAGAGRLLFATAAGSTVATAGWHVQEQPHWHVAVVFTWALRFFD